MSTWQVEWPLSPLPSAASRTALLARIRSATQRQSLRWLAFGLADDALRLALSGERARLGRLSRAIKVGTNSHEGVQPFGVMWAEEALSPEVAITWAHAAVLGDPLATPWTSARDLLGHRVAPFFCARSSWSETAPEAPPSPLACSATLAQLLQVSGSVMGRGPADPAVFPLFAQLARDHGWSTGATARALALTPRRVRQLRARAHPALPLAQRALADPRLRVTG